MSCFDSLKDFEVDFKDLRESNPQYAIVLDVFGQVFEDLLYGSLYNKIIKLEKIIWVFPKNTILLDYQPIPECWICWTAFSGSLLNRPV